MKKRKVCFVITTRGNYAKLKPVIKSCEERDDLETQLIVAGGAILSKFGNIINQVEKEFTIHRKIPFIIEGENLLAMAKSAGIALSEFATVFENLKPDWVVVVGDRYETLAVTMAAAYMNIAVAHLEGGEVSGSIDESIRHAITKLAHLHFPCSAQAASRILRLGESPDTVFTVGATSLDTMLQLNLNDLSALHQAQKVLGVGPVVNLDDGYLLVLFHPVTTEYDGNSKAIDELIEVMYNFRSPTIWLWPNMDAGSDLISHSIRASRERYPVDHIHFFKSLPIELFGPALYNTRCIIGNSSCGIRESAYFGIPSVTIGSRQNGREKGKNVFSVPAQRTEIMKAVEKQLEHGKYEPNILYGDGKTSSKIAEKIATTDIQIQKQIAY